MPICCGCLEVCQSKQVLNEVKSPPRDKRSADKEPQKKGAPKKAPPRDSVKNKTPQGGTAVDRRSVKKAVKESVKKPVKEPVKKPVKESVKESVKKPVKAPAQESNSQEPEAVMSPKQDSKTMTALSTKESLKLVDEQWKVSGYKNNNSVTLDKVQLSHSVDIFNCENSTFVINVDKFKSMQIQNCKKCNVVLNSLISAIEIISSSKTKVQIKGTCSSVTIDKCIGVEIYLSKKNEETEFTTALSAEMNVHLEGKTPDEDWKEITIPEQYQHVLADGNLKTRVSDLYKF